MKALIAAASAAAMASLAPALAHAQDSTSLAGVYANVGYANSHADDVNLGAIGARLGYRFNNYVGVEGELAGGVKSDDVELGGGVSAKVKLQHSEAIYAVGFLPIAPNWDVLGRVGYGSTKLKASALGASAEDDGDSWNFGLGAQYHWDGVNGVRVDYTRQEFRGDDAGPSDVWAIAYSRRF
jgi:hypothetical protein